MKQTVKKDAEENDVAKKRKKQSKRNKMLIICRELCFLLIVTLTAYATVLNSQTKAKRGAPCVPFFRNTNVHDFYQGDLNQLLNEVGTATYSFVLFYAPWDADSQDLRYEFLETAEFYNSQVYFAGVNCWEPGSECRLRFKEVEKYPQLVVYIGLEKAVEYKGPHKADYMIKFLYSIIHPIERLNLITDLWKIRYLHDAVLVGYLQINGPSENGLDALYDTSITLASKDYTRRIAVAIFTHTKINAQMGIIETPTIQLYVWNKKIEYSGLLKRAPLLNWVLENLNQQLISLDGLLLLKPPTVVMFTPLNPLALLNPSYHMMRRVAMTIADHLSNKSIEEDFFSYIIRHNPAFQSVYYQDLVKKETDIRDLCSKLMLGDGTCSSSPKWNNFTCTAQRTQWISNGDESKILTLKWQEEQCKILDRAPLMPETIPQPAPGFALNTSFGFACLDSNLFFHLANALGIDLSYEPEETAIAIIGGEDITKVPVANEETLWVTLHEWIHGKREHTFYREKEVVQMVREKGAVYLPNIGLKSFTHLIQQSDQHALILYHSRYCGICPMASHHILELSYLLTGSTCIYVARVDGDKVDLPWHFRLHVFPSLLFLPAIKKSESRLFPVDVPWEFTTLTKFIISNINIEERPEVMLAFCGRWGIHPEKSFEGTECIREARKLSIEGIALRLKEVRKHRNSKTLLKYLSFLKEVHLALARVIDINESLAVIRSLSKDYHVGCSVT